MQSKLTSINGREKIAPEKWDKTKRDQHKPAHGGEDNSAMIKTPTQPLHVTIAYFLERMIKPLMNAKEKKRYRTEDSCWGPVATADLFAAVRRKVFFPAGRILRAACTLRTVIELARETGIDFLHMPAQQEFHHCWHNGAGEKI